MLCSSARLYHCVDVFSPRLHPKTDELVCTQLFAGIRELVAVGGIKEAVIKAIFLLSVKLASMPDDAPAQTSAETAARRR